MDNIDRMKSSTRNHMGTLQQTMSNIPLRLDNFISQSCSDPNYYPYINGLSELSFFGSSLQKRSSNMETMREMIFGMAMMQPVQIDPESVKPGPKRKNVKISKDPQSVAARRRRERISEKIRILQRLVPGGTKMDTASMLDEAAHYLKFLKKQIQSLEQVPKNNDGIPITMATATYSNFIIPHVQMLS